MQFDLSQTKNINEIRMEDEILQARHQLHEGGAQREVLQADLLARAWPSHDQRSRGDQC